MSSNEFDNIESLRIDSSIAEIETEDVRTEVKIERPSKQIFFRAHSSAEYRLDTMLLKYEPENRWYLPSPNLWRELREELSTVKLVTCIEQSGEIFLWPIKLPLSDQPNRWTTSALAAVDVAVNHWVRLIPDMSKGRYRVQKAISELGEPQWPEFSFLDLINEAFGEYQITSLDHPIVKQLRGKR